MDKSRHVGLGKLDSARRSVFVWHNSDMTKHQPLATRGFGFLTDNLHPRSRVD